MSGQTKTEKILGNHLLPEPGIVRPGETHWFKVDGIMNHDVTSTGFIKALRTRFGNPVAKGLEIVVTPDHFIPAKDIASAELYKELIDWANEQRERGADISIYPLEGGNYGVCHEMLPSKGHIKPGTLWLGPDSHTCTYGSLGAFSTGIGTTEGGYALLTGKMWLTVPETMRIDVRGKMPRNVMAKDLFLRVVGDIGVEGARYMAMQWGGETISSMSQDERSTLTNMAIEAGAKSAIIAPDEITRRYLAKRLTQVGEEELDIILLEHGRSSREYKTKFTTYHWDKLRDDVDALYSKILDVNASKLVPLVAKPHLPSNVVPASELNNVRINQAYIGSCTGGKYEDFVAAAEVLDGKRIASGVRLYCVPATTDIQDRLVKEGIYNTLRESGGIFTMPTCGACLGGHMGVLARGEVAVSSTNRNFVGRMGHKESFVYLASPKTVAASAIAGYITGAEE